MADLKILRKYISLLVYVLGFFRQLFIDLKSLRPRQWVGTGTFRMAALRILLKTFCLIPMKTRQSLFDDYPGFQPKTTRIKHFCNECMAVNCRNWCWKSKFSDFSNHYWILKDFLFSLNLWKIYPILYLRPWKLLNRCCHNVFKLFEHHANHMLWQ